MSLYEIFFLTAYFNIFEQDDDDDDDIFVHGSYIRWLGRIPCARFKWARIFDMFKAIVYIDKNWIAPFQEVHLYVRQNSK